MTTAYTLFNILVFPGFLFLTTYALLAEFVDRKLYARFQNRFGPPWFQPFADFVKLVSKETIIPCDADRRMFKLLPLFALAASYSVFLYIPIWGMESLFSFNGDVIVVLYLLTIPTIVFSLAGWSSTSLYATVGSLRTMTQLFAYEVPLFMAILSPALLSGSWSITEMAKYYHDFPLHILFNIPAFVVALIAVQGKLERLPFDIPEAETEIVHGAFIEYSGGLLAMFRLATDVEMIVLSALLSAIFFPLFVENPIIGMLLFFVKTLFIIFLLAIMRSVLARIRIDQMVRFCWLYLAPISTLQILLIIIAKGVLLQ
ncbi:MAG: complex I subunit 1/NuoH family protein [Candidatus Omnitrophota bacterium]